MSRIDKLADEPFTAGEKWFMVGVLAIGALFVGFYYGKQAGFENGKKEAVVAPVAAAPIVMTEPVKPPIGSVVGMIALPYKGRKLIEVKSNSGFTCFVALNATDEDPLAVSCQPTPPAVKP